MDAVRHDFRLAPASQLIGKDVAPGEANVIDLTPHREYVHPRKTRALRSGLDRRIESGVHMLAVPVVTITRSTALAEPQAHLQRLLQALQSGR